MKFFDQETVQQQASYIAVASMMLLILAFGAGMIVQQEMTPRTFGAAGDNPSAEAQAKVEAQNLKIYKDAKAPRENLLLEFKDAQNQMVYVNSMLDLNARIDNARGDILLIQKDLDVLLAMKQRAYADMQAQGITDPAATSTP